jgi:hypothetical protein
MAMETERLIEQLADRVTPVRPLRNPWIRTAEWLALAVPCVALGVLVMAPRSDLPAKLSDARFVIEQIAALATGLTAAVAAFASTIPGRRRRFLLLPALPLAVWIGSLGQGCLETWVHAGPDGLRLEPDWACVTAIAAVGVVPAIAMAIMLRRGAPLTPSVTVALGALAAAGLADFGLRLVHTIDASLMVLVWQFGTVLGLTLLAGFAGRRIVNWRSVGAPVGD